ncbi:hypothetical protein RJ640_017455 [Escallonia rubra]|uniref:Pentatricopeptide repeat-containing protein n=1 Tax=Escallonia rubra TaxID=112253 RepID=A0AA88UNY2_9ASTE|nr:hypothetical protein RJ640_017455 [Escallonia rubra]
MMWKSSVAVAIAARRRASSVSRDTAAAASISRSNSLAPHQVPSHHSKTLASYKPHPHFSSFHRNPIRTFSEYSSIATDHHHDAIADPRFPDIINQPDPIENTVFDENPSSVPPESEDTTAQLDEFLAGEMMWKSSVAVAAARRASVIRDTAAAAAAAAIFRSNSFVPHEVPPNYSQTLTSYKNHPHLSSFHRNPIRFFSDNPSIGSSHHRDAIADPRFYDIINQPDPFENTVFDENPSSVSSEAEDTTAQLDESVAVGEKENPTSVDVEQLESVLSLLQSGVDGSFEFSLDNMKLALHEEFVVRVIGTPLVPGENLIAFFKWALSKPEVTVTTRVVDALVQTIGGDLRKRNAYALWDLVKEIGEKENGVLTMKILNELLSLLSRLGKGKAAFEVFNKFREFACVPDADSYYFIVEALCR